MKILYFFVISTFLLSANIVEIVEGVPYIQIESNGKTYKIERTQNENSYLHNTFALTSRPSPPFFIEPFSITPRVETYGELEVLGFISKKKGIFIDARLPNWYVKSTIPGSTNIPFKFFLSKNLKRKNILKNLGVVYVKNGKPDFAMAKTILLYCNGAWCGQSPTAIKALIKLGYPEKKIKYYRGGMQAWQLTGLTTLVPKEMK